MFTSDDPDREIYELFSHDVAAAIDLFIVDWFYKTHQDFSPILHLPEKFAYKSLGVCCV